MRKVGTISSAAGLIFLGVWMIISKVNPESGEQIFKWWPVVIIVLGIEVLLQINKKGGRRPGINPIIIPVLLVLLSVNIFQGLKSDIGEIVRGIDIDNIQDIRIGGFRISGTKSVKTSKILQANGNRLYLSTDNARLNVKKSTDGNIKIDGNIYVDNDRAIESYEINEKIEEDGYTIGINEKFVKRVELDIYIPDGYELRIKADNIDIKGNDKFIKSAVNIESSNGNIELAGAASVQIKFDNGNAYLKDIKDINIIGDNSNIELDGEIENIKINSDLGRVEINNEICRNVDIQMDQGVINLKTNDENVDVNIELNQGVTEINDSKFANAGSRKTFGTGEGKVRIKMDQGAVKFRN